jgi:hypothetical protein
MVENINTQMNKYSLMHLSWYLCVIRVLKALGSNDYNINLMNTLFKITLWILVIFYVEMKLQMPQNSSKLKFCFNVFVISFDVIHVIKVWEHRDYNKNK